MERTVIDLSSKSIKMGEKGFMVVQFANLYDRNRDVLINQLTR